MPTSSKIEQSQYLQWLEEILKEGKNATVRVNGMSMFPTLLPKDIVCVQPVKKNLLKPGTVILFQGTSGWVAHRLLRIDRKNNRYISRGDANLHKDLPLSYDEIKGIVIGVTQQRLFWSNWAVHNCGRFIARISFITAPLFWLMGRVVVWSWKWTKKVRGLK